MTTVTKQRIEDLERDKYQLLEKVKALEMGKSSQEADLKRSHQRLKDSNEKLNLLTTKYEKFKEKQKVEQKNICGLFRCFTGVLKKTSEANVTVMEYLSKIFHGLAIQRDTDLKELKLFDGRAALETVFNDELVKSFQKIEIGKLRSQCLASFGEAQDFSEKFQLFDTTYKSLLKRMQSGQGNNAELALLVSSFEQQRNLMKENNALLRSNNRGSIDLGRVGGNLDESIHYRSNSMVDDSLLLAGDVTDRSIMARRPSHIPISCEESSMILDQEESILASPKKRYPAGNTQQADER